MSSTLNQLLVHGARHHDRDGLFLHRENGEWIKTPDWRADRHSIRIALALHERFGVEPGETVALSMSLRLEWPLIERAVWGLGAITVLGVTTDAGAVVSFQESGTGFDAPSARAIIAFDDGSYRDLVEHGGFLDTPERASRFRARAREIPPEALASIENGRELTHAAWMEEIARFRVRHPPAPGRTQLIASNVTDHTSRVALYSAWGDGMSRVAFGAEVAGTYPEGFVRLLPEHE